MGRFILMLIVASILYLPSAYAYMMCSSPPVSGECTNYLVCQNFEGTGYDNSETWTETLNGGTINEDYTSIILRGSQSLYIKQPTDTANAVAKSPSFTNQSTVYGFFRVEAVTSFGDFGSTILELQDSSNVMLFRIYFTGIGILRTLHGSTLVDTDPTTYSVGTVYYIWWDYTAGGGANGTGHVYIGTTTTKPGSPVIIQSAGTATGNGDHITLVGGYNSTGYYLFDQAYVSTSDIGNVSN